LRTRGISTNVSTVKRMRHKLGFKRTTTKYCHTIRDQNQAARVDFCSEEIEEGRTYSNCVFTDECTVQIGCSTRFCFVKEGDQFSRLGHRAKHPA
uniref:HTH_Tnp_Tc3_2 domain-containing protein n=1 Tax=Heligmosomoides polygyrus TaxID=6339 RepID=A0A183FB59_HELPZ